MGIKQSLYADLGASVKPSAVFASNTSSFEIGALSGASGRPDKVVRAVLGTFNPQQVSKHAHNNNNNPWRYKQVGLHFFNPVQIMKLVEVVQTPDSSPESFDLAVRVGQALGKQTVKCKDTPGFVVNR